MRLFEFGKVVVQPAKKKPVISERNKLIIKTNRKRKIVLKHLLELRIRLVHNVGIYRCKTFRALFIKCAFNCRTDFKRSKIFHLSFEKWTLKRTVHIKWQYNLRIYLKNVFGNFQPTLSCERKIHCTYIYLFFLIIFLVNNI